MTKEQSDGKLHIDADWKEEAAREKERLAAQEKMEPAAAGAGGERPVTGFIELVNILVMQIAVALGGVQGPGGERIPPNPASAKHLIDMLEVLERKTRGNLTDDEKRVLDSALYELRLQYVQTFSKAPASDPARG